MSYKTILVLADCCDAQPVPTEVAAQIAIAEQAHLVGVAMSGVDQVIYQCNAAAPGLVVLPADLTPLTARADQALATFAQRVERLGVNSFETRRIDGAADLGLIMHARYADLLVLPRAVDRARPSPGPDTTLQYVILHCGKPVLVVPCDGEARRVGRRPLLAWDGSLEAARALSAALPLLRRAELVTLAVFNGDQVYGAHGALAGADMSLYLARHGIKVELRQQDTPDGAGHALMALAGDLDADLLVMGCYGHTRLREILLGGATRDVLRGMTLPVLMAH
ncbi:universal stress protein [Duganella radicis]|uniref:Universal stress protein n=1 Tax=Duganella radicis TaxID=551988 RepID=A0A6L6PCN2_9BURK|nr:universal stress protein [Duganella radicis]MTV36351.1 universal stress protein [Duganella radicis]